jgi:GAF domain-containing protein
VELAAYICEAPIALITLIDEQRQWFKSQVGISIKETTRDISFCTHAIAQPHLFIVPDTLADARFAKNPFVLSKPKIRFYAGAPLVTNDGHALGTLCVLDKVPRQLRPDQAKALQVLARHVMNHLESRRSSGEATRLREERDDLRRELNRLKSREKPGARAVKTLSRPAPKSPASSKPRSISRKR